MAEAEIMEIEELLEIFNIHARKAFLNTPRVELDNKTPKEVLKTDPERVRLILLDMRNL